MSQYSIFDTTVPTIPSSSLIGARVKLDRADHCHDDIAVIGSTKGDHHGSLTCAMCGRHRGWLPAQAITFISEARDIFGIADEVVVLRDIIQHKEASMAKDARQNQDYDNTNRGALFKNAKKQQGDKRPDYNGSLDVDGREMWLSAWITKSKSGVTFMSLAVRPKDDAGSTAGGAPF